MLQRASPYNIPEPDPMYAGSYTELDFKLTNDSSIEKIDLTNIPNIRFSMSIYGDYSNPALEFTLKDNTENETYIKIDNSEKNHMTVFLYANQTESFDDSYYDFQIEFLDFDRKSNSIVGQGKIKVFGKISNR